VGVAVYSNVGEARGSDTNTPSAVGVAGMGVRGVRDGGLPPGGVGVWYCPQREAFPTQALSMAAVTRKIIARFT